MTLLDTLFLDFTIRSVPIIGASSGFLEFRQDDGQPYDFTGLKLRMEIGPALGEGPAALTLTEDAGQLVPSEEEDTLMGGLYNAIQVNFPYTKTGIVSGSYAANLWVDLIIGSPDESYIIGAGTVVFSRVAST